MTEAAWEHLSDQAILDFTYITMLYSMHAVISQALHLEFDDRADPIVEVAAPEDYRPENLGRQIVSHQSRVPPRDCHIERSLS